jgi:hypothetical protein
MRNFEKQIVGNEEETAKYLLENRGRQRTKIAEGK